MRLTDKDYAEFKALCEKEGIKYNTEAEYQESARNLVGFVKATYRIAEEEFQRESRLKDEPGGFAMNSSGRTCRLCHASVSGEMWYDEWGMKCFDCQQALKDGIVPGYVFKDYENEEHITASQLSWKLDIHSSTIRKLVRQNKLVARVLPHSGTLVFLREENPNLPEVVEQAKRSLKN